MQIDKKLLVIAVLLLIIACMVISTFSAAVLTNTYETGIEDGSVGQLNFIITQIQQSGIYTIPLNEQINLACGFQEIQT